MSVSRASSAVDMFFGSKAKPAPAKAAKTITGKTAKKVAPKPPVKRVPPKPPAKKAAPTMDLFASLLKSGEKPADAPSKPGSYSGIFSYVFLLVETVNTLLTPAQLRLIIGWAALVGFIFFGFPAYEQ